MSKYKSINIIKAISNENRVKLIFCLSKPQSVTDLLNKCDLSQSALSQHLKILKNTGVAVCKKEGKQQIYSVNNPKILSLVNLLLTIK